MTEPRFLEQLQELDAKAAAVREQEARGTAACADVRGVLDRLRVKVRAGGEPRDQNQPPRTSPRLSLPELMLTFLGSPEDLKKQGCSPPFLLLCLTFATSLSPPNRKEAAAPCPFGPPYLGGDEDPRVHPSEDLFLQKTNDQLSDPPDGPAEVQVTMGGWPRSRGQPRVVSLGRQGH